MRTAELLVPESLEKELSGLIQAAHALGSDGCCVLPGSSSVSAKLDGEDSFGRKDTLLFVSGRDERLESIQAPGFSSFHNQRLVDLIAWGGLDEQQLGFEILSSQTPARSLGTSAL